MLAGLFLSLHGIGKQMCNAFYFGFIRFCFHEMSGEPGDGGRTFAGKEVGGVCRHTSPCGGMVANKRKGCIQSDSIHTDKITPKPPQKNEQNIR